MLIHDLELQTGLDRAAIRFYEKEGLISPHRAENGYRTYTDTERDMLLKIKLLRQLGMSLECIKQLQQGSADFSKALTEQIRVLEKNLRDMDRAKEVCIDIRNTGTTFRDLDASYYLKELSKASRPEDKWKPQPVPEFSRSTPVHPWKRYFARLIDLSILELAALFLTAVVLRIRPINDFIYSVIGFSLLIHLFWLPIEGLLLHYWRTTPGKWIFGIRVESANGGRLPISVAIGRAWDVLHYGFGYCIPFYIYWRLYKSYRQYNDDCFLPWDREWDTEIHFDYNYPGKKKAVIVCMAAAFLLTYGTYLADCIKPKHRGEDLTVAQIAANHNDLLHMLSEDETATLTMNLREDGTWRNYQINNGSNEFVISIGSDAVGGYQDYQYEIQDGFVRSIAYEQTWTNIFHLQPIGTRVICTAKSIAFAQDWLTIWNADEIEKEMNMAFRNRSGEFIYKNLEILWETESENCNYSGDSFYAENDELPSFVTLKLKIYIHDIP